MTKADLDKMGPALQRMLEEEPCARVERSATGEQLLLSMGETHVAVIGERLKRKFGSAIVTHTPRIPYHETIRGRTKVEGKYKKQTGGHGMFGHVWIEIEPNPDGGVAFAEHVVGGTVPKNFFPGVEKGIRQAAVEGVLAGYPLIDFKATLYDGSFHTVDSNNLSFQIAASMALKKGVMDCKPVLQEPIMAVEIRIPERFMGDVNRDLNGRRGRVLGMDVTPRRLPGDHGPRPPGGAVQLRHRAAVDHRRARARSHRPWTTTRTCRRTSATRSSRRTARSRRPARTDGSPRGSRDRRSGCQPAAASASSRLIRPS